MKLENQFSIAVPVEEAWKVLLDIERVAPCVPGATLTSNEGDQFKGKVKVKLGPISLSYAGIIKFRSRDEEAKIAVLEGSGREARGNGTASAVVTCRLVDAGDTTDVFVETELDITGKPAQFGRGAMAEVAGKLIGQFSENLAAEIENKPDVAPAEVAAPASETATSETAAPAVAPVADKPVVPRKSAEPIDLIEASGLGGVATRTAIAVAVSLVVAAVVVLFFGRRRAS
ncbi:SRPBCC family protein [Nocardia sp. 348MFTsu5.1]|uniref:SRPBCC family protein n=1 Tax=Nocardia sp. 348MFTsu5.1 TaxID=1172185 RepID=UPI00037AB957|nr:SRPBCC family protein [Nocardia sp. 348MFTsu5.1]